MPKFILLDRQDGRKYQIPMSDLITNGIVPEFIVRGMRLFKFSRTTVSDHVFSEVMPYLVHFVGPE